MRSKFDSYVISCVICAITSLFTIETIVPFLISKLITITDRYTWALTHTHTYTLTHARARKTRYGGRNPHAVDFLAARWQRCTVLPIRRMPSGAGHVLKMPTDAGHQLPTAGRVAGCGLCKWGFKICQCSRVDYADGPPAGGEMSPGATLFLVVIPGDQNSLALRLFLTRPKTWAINRNQSIS